ncbi:MULTISPECIES: ABC transporter ATP-binding protein [Ferrimonas]|uniref:ABC transporter ATP-binding protein n=1 Tax=Ferrimonas TaxID=44011 RepID=UPI00041DCEF6|nr:MULTISPECIES: ABC transporter ATP-binding protein [Ferrimonas]USD38176.1 ABC transporter ATP-binding protein [Ferrimonas sp. SCSIO 43195]
MTDSAVTVSGAVKRFSGVNALNGVSLELQHGQLLGLLGHNGAGKTTLIKLILGLNRPDEGTVRVLGQDPALAANRAGLSIGYLPEHVSLYDNLSGLELLTYFARLRGIGGERVEEVLEQLQLAHAQSRKVRTYSKGMRQRLGLAQAILAKPRVLILDEPTVGLDPQASAMLYQQVAGLRQQGCAVIICTHELTLIDKHLDSALILAKGRAVAQGSIWELRQKHRLPTRVEVAGAERLAGRDMQLAALYDPIEQAFMVPDGMRKPLLERLIHQHGVFDFNVLPPSLPQIYHDCQHQALAEEVA